MKKNTGYLDVLRFVAIIVVVLIHTVSGVSTQMPERMTVYQLSFYNSIKNICTIGVPLFLMISGVLFLNPEKEVSIKDLLFKYVRRIVLALLIFGTAYALLEIIFGTRDFKPVYLWEAFYQMLLGNTWGHMWYLYMLIGIYLLIPLLKPFVKATTKEMYTYVLIMLFVVSSVLPFIKIMTGFAFGASIVSVQVTEFVVYIFYFLAGYYIHTYLREQIIKSSKTLIIGMIIIFAEILIISINEYTQSSIYISYDSPIVVILALTVFVLGCRLQGEYKLCTKLRPFLFGIYLVHTFYLNLLYKLLGVTPLECGGYILIPLFAIGVFLLSLVSVWIMRLIPPLRKYVL